MLYAPYRGRLGNQIESLYEALELASFARRRLRLPYLAQTHEIDGGWVSGPMSELFNVSRLESVAGCGAPLGVEHERPIVVSRLLHLTSRPLVLWHYEQARVQTQKAPIDVRCSFCV